MKIRDDEIGEKTQNFLNFFLKKLTLQLTMRLRSAKIMNFNQEDASVISHHQPRR